MRIFARTLAAIVVVLVPLATGGCLLTTTAPPLEPGIEQLPSASISAREQIVINQLTMLKRAEDLYFAKKASYGTLEEMVADGAINVAPQGLGYSIDVTADDHSFQMLAVPVEYGPKGKRSFYLDESGVVRGDDHQGGAPSVSDPPV